MTEKWKVIPECFYRESKNRFNTSELAPRYFIPKNRVDRATPRRGNAINRKKPQTISMSVSKYSPLQHSILAMNATRRAGIGFTMALSVVLLTAQDRNPLHLTVQQAVQLALKQNSDLETARLEVKRAEARVMEAWGYTMPSIDLSGQYMHFVDKPVTFFPDYFLYSFMKGIDSTFPKPTGQLVPISFTPGFTASGTVTVKQLLFNGAVFVGVGAASVYSQLASDVYRMKRVETVTKVRKAYYAALLAAEARSLMRSTLRNAEDNLRNVTLLHKQGIISEYDELRATVGVENLRPTVLQTETNADLALFALKNTLGVPHSESMTLTDTLGFVSVADSVLVHAEQDLLESNPTLSVARWQIELNGAAVNAERSSYLPTLALFGSYQYQAAKNEFNFSTNDFFKGTNVGLSLSLNLFQGVQTWSRVEQAQLEQRKSEEQRTNLERNLKTGLHSVIGALRQAQKRGESQLKTVEMATRGYTIVTTRFLASAATQLEVNDALLALMQARVNRVQAIYDYLIAAADLDQLIGRVPSYAAGGAE
jgi:outer membrane protein TolC